MTSLEWGGFVGLWLSRMEISGVGRVKTGTSRTKFFIVTNGQLLSSSINNEYRSDQNCPITASAEGSEWAATACLGNSSLFTGQNLGEICGTGEGELMSFSLGQRLFLSTVWQTTIWSWGWLSSFLCLRTKAVGAGATMECLLRLSHAIYSKTAKDWRTDVVLWLNSLTLLLNVLGCLCLLQNP